MAVPAGALIQKSHVPHRELTGPDPGSLPEALREAFEERAAILEFDGKLERGHAEGLAWAAIVGQRRTH